MKKILFALLFFTAFAVQAKEVVVSALGEGEDYDWAVLNAVENAVRQTNDITIEGNGLQKIDVSSSINRERTISGNSLTQAAALLNASGEYGKRGKLDAKGNYQRNSDLKVNDNENITASIKDNSKSIPVKYKGIVSSYEVIEHTENNGKHQVKITAVVNKECRQIPNCETTKNNCSCYACKTGYKLIENECLPCEDKEVCSCTEGKKWSTDEKKCIYDAHDYKSKGLVKKADYSLAVLPFKATKQLNCLGKKVSIDELNTLITNAFVEKLAPSRKFNLVDRNNLDNYASELALITDDMTLPKNKVKLKNIVSADYILVGTIENFMATSKKEYLELTGETSYESSSKLKLSYRILEAATMEIVSAGFVEKKFSKNDAFSSCYNVEELLINRAIAEACEKLLTDIFPDYKPVKQEAKNSTTKTAKPAKPVDYSLQLD